MRRMPAIRRSAMAALKLLEMGEGKSVSQIASEFGFSNSGVVCSGRYSEGAGSS